MACKDCNKIKSRLKASEEQYFLFRSKVEKLLLDFLEDYKDLFESLEKSNRRNKALTEYIVKRRVHLLDEKRHVEELFSLFAQGRSDKKNSFEDIFGLFGEYKNNINGK